MAASKTGVATPRCSRSRSLWLASSLHGSGFMRATCDRPLCLSLALLGGACLDLAPLPSLAVAAGALLLLGRDLGWKVVVFAVVLFAFGGWRASLARNSFEAAHRRAKAELGVPQRCAGTGHVATSPTRRGTSISYVAHLGQLECERSSLSGPVSVRLYGGPASLGRGDRIEVVAQLAPTRFFRNFDLPDPRPAAVRRETVLSGGVLGLVLLEQGTGLGRFSDDLRAHARERILATYSADAQGMARALVLGENDLPPEDDRAFRLSGLSHLLAVSGTHLVFAVVTLTGLLRKLLACIPALAARWDVARFASAAGALLALAYADFAGGSGSAWRAAWMLSAAFLTRACARQPRGARALAASLFVGCAYDPLAVYDLSFLLSAAATAGLMLLGQPLAKRCERIKNPVLRYLSTGTVATVASMIPCAPLLALLAPSLTLAGILANLVAAPMGELVALPLSLAHGLLSWCPPLERGAALLASGALVAVKRIAHWSADAEDLAFGVPAPTAWHLTTLCLGGLALWKAWAQRSWLQLALTGLALSGALVLCERATQAQGNPTHTLRITTLDVGQGDSTLVDFPDGKLMLIDGGGFMGSPVDPGERVILPTLRARRRERIDVVVLSHPHPDHFGGLLRVLKQVEVGELWDTGQGRKEGAGPVYRQLLVLAKRRGVKVLGPRELCGNPRSFGEARIEALGPCPDFIAGRNANDNSLVLRVSYRGRHALFTGDAEKHQEAELQQQGAPLQADFLKVGHHGSRTSSTPAFLTAVQPRLATISSGIRNRYGHPHVESLSQLQQAQVNVLRLDLLGAVQYSWDGRTERLRSWADQGHQGIHHSAGSL